MIEKIIMSKSGKRKRKVQTYKCENEHRFQAQHSSPWTDSFIEYVVYIYLRCLSLNTTIDIIRATYEEKILTKGLVLEFIERVADALPTIDDVDRIYEPRRSGYLAFDGVWFKLRGEDIVLLVCFDPETFDIISANWSKEEDKEGYVQLMNEVLSKLPYEEIRGVYGDGDRGLISALGECLRDVPFQLCIVHKEMRMGQIVPIKSVERGKKMAAKVKGEIRHFQELFRSCLYTDTKDEAKENLVTLDKYVQTITGANASRFSTAYRSLKRNFSLTLTHFDHTNMMRDNNLIECFNGCLKPRLKLMKSFKKVKNLDRYLTLFLLEFRFRSLRESRFKNRRVKNPLELGDVQLGEYWNFINYLRNQLRLSYQQNP